MVEVVTVKARQMVGPRKILATSRHDAEFAGEVVGLVPTGLFRLLGVAGLKSVGAVAVQEKAVRPLVVAKGLMGPAVAVIAGPRPYKRGTRRRPARPLTVKGAEAGHVVGLPGLGVNVAPAVGGLEFFAEIGEGLPRLTPAVPAGPRPPFLSPTGDAGVPDGPDGRSGLRPLLRPRPAGNGGKRPCRPPPSCRRTMARPLDAMTVEFTQVGGLVAPLVLGLTDDTLIFGPVRRIF